MASSAKRAQVKQSSFLKQGHIFLCYSSGLGHQFAVQKTRYTKSLRLERPVSCVKEHGWEVSLVKAAYDGVFSAQRILIEAMRSSTDYGTIVITKTTDRALIGRSKVVSTQKS